MFSSNSVVLAALVAVARLLDDLLDARVHLPDGGVRPDRVLVLCEGSGQEESVFSSLRSSARVSSPAKLIPSTRAFKLGTRRSVEQSRTHRSSQARQP